MILKGIVEEDFVNYYKPSMVLMFPTCSFKCDHENGVSVCHNSAMAQAENIEVNIDKLIERYLENPITSAIVCSGLEPFDSRMDLHNFISTLRNTYDCDDDVVIYTGYSEKESEEHLTWLKQYPNIYVKYGRFIPNKPLHFDSVLKVNLSSANQYGVRVS